MGVVSEGSSKRAKKAKQPAKEIPVPEFRVGYTDKQTGKRVKGHPFAMLPVPELWELMKPNAKGQTKLMEGRAQLGIIILIASESISKGENLDDRGLRSPWTGGLTIKDFCRSAGMKVGRAKKELDTSGDDDAGSGSEPFMQRALDDLLQRGIIGRKHLNGKEAGPVEDKGGRRSYGYCLLFNHWAEADYYEPPQPKAATKSATAVDVEVEDSAAEPEIVQIPERDRTPFVIRRGKHVEAPIKPEAKKIRIRASEEDDFSVRQQYTGDVLEVEIARATVAIATANGATKAKETPLVEGVLKPGTSVRKANETPLGSRVFGAAATRESGVAKANETPSGNMVSGLPDDHPFYFQEALNSNLISNFLAQWDNQLASGTFVTSRLVNDVLKAYGRGPAGVFFWVATAEVQDLLGRDRPLKPTFYLHCAVKASNKDAKRAWNQARARGFQKAGQLLQRKEAMSQTDEAWQIYEARQARKAGGAL